MSKNTSHTKAFFPAMPVGRALRGKGGYLLFGNIEQHFIAFELNFEIVE